MSFLKIMLVEDEFLIALDLEQILLDAGHDVVGIASTAADALRIARDERPQLAFVDVDLVDVPTGLDIARKFTELDAPLPVFITSNPLEGTLECGAGLMAKPYLPNDVVNAAAYLAQGILKPPPVLTLPRALRLSAQTLRRFSSSPS